MIRDGLQLRALTEDDIDAYLDCMVEAFGVDPAGDPQASERLRTLIDRSRAWCGVDGVAVVGTCATWTMDLAVCGGVVPMAGLTHVSVRSTHRRRGLLRAMIGAHLDDAAARGEPVSGLWASDAPIYGRYGYGIAAEGDELEAGPDAGFARGRALDALELLTDDAAAATLPALYARALALRPGMFSRTATWWQARRFTDRPDRRRGRSPRRHVISVRAGAPTGYAVYRQHLDFADGRPAGTVDIEELVGLDPIAEATLWHHLTHLDLFPRVAWWNAPTDCLAPLLADDRRRFVRRRRADTLWLRIGDVGRALAGRAYLDDGALALAVVDAMSGNRTTWQLTADGGRATCVATDAAPELEVEQAALGAMYLGGTSAALLAGTGAVRGTPAAVARADRLFRWPVAPWCPEVF